MSTAAIIGGTIAGAGISAGTSLAAAGEQAGAAKSAAQLEHEYQEEALKFQEQEYQTEQAQIAPWLKAGQGAIGNLFDLANGGLPAWNKQFQAPTAAQAAETPGYQFTLQQGQQALQNSAAARGGLLSTGTAKQLDQYTTGLANQTYGDVYNRSFNEYLQNYNQYQQAQANQFNRLAAVAGIGQTAVGQAGQFGQAAASNLGNIFLTGGAQQGQALQNAGAARASGYVGAGNALGGALGNLSLYQLLQNFQPNVPSAPTGGNI